MIRKYDYLLLLIVINARNNISITSFALQTHITIRRFDSQIGQFDQKNLVLALILISIQIAKQIVASRVYLHRFGRKLYRSDELKFAHFVIVLDQVTTLRH